MSDITPLAELAAALAKAQGAFQPIEKNREVEITTKAGYKYKFRYADLEEIITKTRPALASNGLAMIQTVEHGQNGPLLTCKLMHSGGGMMTSEVLIPSARDMAADPKTFGAAITYFRRYMVTAMLGVAADDDLDADGQEAGQQQQQQPAGQKPAVNQPQRREPSANAAAQKEAPAKQAAAGDTSAATPGEIAFITKKITAKGMSIAQAREAASLEAGDTLDGLTKDGFAAIKAALA